MPLFGSNGSVSVMGQLDPARPSDWSTFEMPLVSTQIGIMALIRLFCALFSMRLGMVILACYGVNLCVQWI